MKKKVVILLNCLVVLFCIGLLIYSLFLAPEREYGLIARCVVVLVSYLLAVSGVKNKRSVFDYKVYEDLYKDIIKGAFTEDKKNYRKLLNVAVYYNRNQYKKAYKVIDELEKNCKRIRDYSAVYMFKALCLEDEKRYDEALEVYRSVVRYDAANSRAWSNLGLRYLQKGNYKDAYSAYASAILYDPKNAYAHNNMASYYVRTGEAKEALKYAQQALELDGRLYQAMSAAAIAYKMLGDEANAEKYCKMYAVNGGDGKKLKQKLASI